MNPVNQEDQCKCIKTSKPYTPEQSPNNSTNHHHSLTFQNLFFLTMRQTYKLIRSTQNGKLSPIQLRPRVPCYKRNFNHKLLPKTNALNQLKILAYSIMKILSNKFNKLTPPKFINLSNKKELLNRINKI